MTLPGSSLWIVSRSLHSCIYIKILLPWHSAFGIYCPHTFCCQGPHALLRELTNHRALFDVAISQIPCLLSVMFSERGCRSACAVFLPHIFIFTVRNHHHFGDSTVARCCFAFSQMSEADTSSFHRYHALQHCQYWLHSVMYLLVYPTELRNWFSIWCFWLLLPPFG
jgi:hypothetical protein